MYCPNCATETVINQKFCRSCGMSLALVSQAMLSQTLVSEATTGQSVVPGSGDEHPSTAFREDRSEHRQSKFMRWGFVLLFAGLVFTILMGVGGDEVQRVNFSLGHFMNSLAGVGAAILLAGVGLIVYAGLLPAIKPSHAPRRAISPPAPAIKDPSTAPTTASMEPSAESLPSITEHTTYTLGPQKRNPISH
ncbi:MAG TPA: zinc ribbon domain-containing protein [Blastocatellia bacterium]|nr:zinc ribbon domain-containing protein [Blastocatellia bacterium]